VSPSTPYSFVVPLRAIPPTLHAQVGGKAINLSRLLRAGFPVPDGFCVTASACRDHLLTPELVECLRLALSEIKADPGRRKFVLERLRQTLVDAPLSKTLSTDLAGGLRALTDGLVAVRSSALGEDSLGQSFAGMHDTLIGIRGEANLEHAIKACWASLWTERALEYRAKNGFEHEAAQMGVVVQMLVAADISGILFTADPVSGNQDRLIIESTFGLGEVLVSGKVTPDRVVLAKRDLSVLQVIVSDKRVESRLVDGRICESMLEPERARSRSLNDSMATRLGELGRGVEDLFGRPQDIEWAVVGDAIHVLQARPITTLPGKGKEKLPVSGASRQVWSNLNAGEVMPDVVSPMTWSYVERLVYKIFSSILEKLGLSLDGLPLLGLVAGRAYFNLNTFAAIMKKIPGLRSMDLTTVFGGGQVASEALGKVTLADIDIPDLNFSLPRVIAHLPGFLLWMMRHTTQGGLRFARKMRCDTLALDSQDLANIPEDGLSRLLHTLVDRSALQTDFIGYAGAGVVYFSQLFAICRRWLGDADGSVANRLLSGIGSMDSATSGLDLWRLAVRAGQDRDLSDTILTADSYTLARERLEKTQPGREFLSAWDAFMLRHGHHCRGEIDFMNARWRETPDSVLKTVRAYLQSAGKIDPLSLHSRHGAERERLDADCRRRLRNPVKRWLFGRIVKQAQLGCLVRENVKSEAVRLLAFGRKILLELGHRLAHRGLLELPEDIFFLRLEEIELIRNGNQALNARRLVLERRKEFDQNLRIKPPPVVVGEFDAGTCLPQSHNPDVRVFVGLAVSAGIATGPARVIARSDTQDRVLPGEVLVAPFTDPGWTPYFLPACAIVMDMGGLLSHGSIIAREYGIPAVVNVGPATEIIRTGQMLRVDGNRGEVQILSDGKN
jgi:phosphohistidine swiveling domain-containing protein